MLRFYEGKRPLGPALSRREWLRIGPLAGLAAGWGPGLLRAEGTSSGKSTAKSTAPGFGRAKSVILVFANGGQSQLDTWDPKPNAPAQVRGDFDSIATAASGVAFCEHLPRVARVADRLTVLRSMTHDDLDHGSAAYLALTGRFHEQKSSNPPPKPEDFPTYGAVLKRVRRNRRFPYTAVHVNAPAVVPERLSPGQFAGFLGHEYEPLVVGDPSQGRVALPSLAPATPSIRTDGRRSLLESLEEARREFEGHDAVAEMNVLYRQAFDVLGSPHCRRAFDLGAEPPELRRRYGEYRSGQACLLARRLVEAGVPLVTVMFNHTNRGQDKRPGETDHYGWDTHNDIFVALREHLLPRFDRSFSTLIEDLDERGLLDDTLVICMGEFGRAPRVAYEASFAGKSPGRKHWARAYSVVLAGAGVSRGAIYGASDRLGGDVADHPVRPGDLVATLYHALGIDPHHHFTDRFGRPFPLATGSPVAGLYG